MSIVVAAPASCSCAGTLLELLEGCADLLHLNLIAQVLQL
jgi:hypothetical protein